MEPRYYGAAANYNKPGGSLLNPKYLMIGGLVLLVIIVLMVATAVINGINAGPGRSLATLVARETDLESLADKNKQHIKSGDLRKISADLGILLLGDTVTLTGYMSSVYNLADVPEDIAADVADPDTDEDLKTAEQTGKFDVVFAAMLNTRLAAILDQAQKVQAAVGNQELKDALQETITTVTSLQEQLASLPT